MQFNTNEEVQEKCFQLQALLGLQSWTIVCEVVDEMPAKSQNSQATIFYNVLKTYAEIKVLRKGKNPLRSLIHELMHASLAWMDPLMKKNPLADLLLEQTVNNIATALENLIVAAANQQTPKQSVVQDQEP